MRKLIFFRAVTVGVIIFLALPLFTWAGPSSANYELKDYSFGSGGTEGSSSANYSMLGISGEQAFDQGSSTNYKAGAGLIFTMQADVPAAPTFTNPASYYNKLKIVVNTGGNPSDSKYAIAISTDNFVADTKYVQNDLTVGTTLGSEDWQTYTAWGGASGSIIIGLLPGVTYTVKVAAKRGNYTMSAYGPTAQAATTTSTLTFDIDVASTDSETSPPFTVPIGSLTAASVVTAPNKVWVDVDTNGTAGTAVYVFDANSGLLSSRANYTIAGVSTNLATVTEGYGARGASATQSAGGPMEIVAPYNGSGNTVGLLDTTKRIIFDSSGATVTAGRAAFELQAKASAVTQAAGDYTDTLTVIASATF